MCFIFWPDERGKEEVGRQGISSRQEGSFDHFPCLCVFITKKEKEGKIFQG